MRKAIAFTGTQEGMTTRQHRRLSSGLYVLKEDGYTLFMHGDCIGADEEADALARPLFNMQIHPPTDESKRAFCKGTHTMMPAMPYLARNKCMVTLGGVLVACPRGLVEEWCSGTWSTVRYARKLGVPIIIIKPTGLVTKERGR